MKIIEIGSQVTITIAGFVIFGTVVAAVITESISYDVQYFEGEELVIRTFLSRQVSINEQAKYKQIVYIK